VATPPFASNTLKNYEGTVRSAEVKQMKGIDCQMLGVEEAGDDIVRAPFKEI